MATLSPPPNEAPVSDLDELEQLFRDSETPEKDFLVGAEAEKFALLGSELTPAPYSGERSILTVLARLEKQFGWQPVSEFPGGPQVALRRGLASITLEPGAQLELSGAPLTDVHQVDRELREHFSELAAVSSDLDLSWYSLGFHPTATPAQISWVPKERYGIMKQYLPTRGSRGADMMQRTSTVQANFDYSSEEDAMRKLRALLPLSPVFQAISANSPFYEGQVSPRRSERADVWLNMDASRSGLIERLWTTESPTYRDYVQWAMDAGMFFFKRNGAIVHNTGQTFREFFEKGFEGHRPTRTDWIWHLGTLFPEVRLKTTLEVRSCDALSADLSAAVIALFTGLVYDSKALAEVESIAESVTVESVRAARQGVPRSTLNTRLGKISLRDVAENLLDVARGGLERRNRQDENGRTEARFLSPLDNLVGRGLSPADLLVQGLEVGAKVDSAMLSPACVATASDSKKN